MQYSVRVGFFRCVHERDGDFSHYASERISNARFVCGSHQEAEEIAGVLSRTNRNQKDIETRIGIDVRINHQWVSCEQYELEHMVKDIQRVLAETTMPRLSSFASKTDENE